MFVEIAENTKIMFFCIFWSFVFLIENYSTQGWTATGRHMELPEKEEDKDEKYVGMLTEKLWNLLE